MYSRLSGATRHRILILYILLMLLAFLLPVPTISTPLPSQSDKVVHIGIFLGFALLYRLDRRPSLLGTFLVSCAFAAAIELVQVVIPYRSGDIWDFVAGAVGAGAGVVISLLFKPRDAVGT